MISMNANNEDCNPKNSIDHNVLRINCPAKKYMAILFFSKPLLHTKYKEIPINKYNKVHTGPNIQLGGLKNGLFNWEYHEFTEVIVNIEPRNPANCGSIIDAINFG